MFCVLQHITNENTYFRNVPFWCLLQKVRTEGDLTNNPDQCTFISQLRETRPRMAALLSRQSQLPQNLLLQPIVLGKQPGVGTVPSSKCQEAWRWWQPACWRPSDSDTHHVFFLWVGAAFCLVWPEDRKKNFFNNKIFRSLSSRTLRIACATDIWLFYGNVATF